MTGWPESAQESVERVLEFNLKSRQPLAFDAVTCALLAKELETRIAKAIEIASTMKSLDAHQRLMAVLEGKE